MNAIHPELYLAVIGKDHRDVRDLATFVLEEIPLDVVEVESVEVALPFFKGTVPMIFADIRLAGFTDGFQLAKEA